MFAPFVISEIRTFGSHIRCVFKIIFQINSSLHSVHGKKNWGLGCHLCKMPSPPEKHSTHFSQHNEVLCGMCVGANGTEQGRREKECHVLLPPIRTHLDTATQGYVALGHMGDTVEGEGGGIAGEEKQWPGGRQRSGALPATATGGRGSVSQSVSDDGQQPMVAWHWGCGGVRG